RGELDGNSALCDFADKLEKATIQTIEEGVMTGDLYLISKLENKKKVDSKTFLLEINNRLAELMK
ncbi:MAG: NADP-dependent isocitrate dehydrogenase, partial [Ruminococcus sp.]